MTTNKDLFKLAENDDVVDSVLRGQTDHAHATRELNARGYDFGRTSVRRAREKMGIVSPKSTRRDEEDILSAMQRHPAGNNRVQKFVILPDFQCDLQDDSFLYRALDLVEYVQPQGIVHVGDENDASSISRWTQGTAEEHIPNQLQRQVDITYHWMKQFRSVPSVETFDVCYSNHGMRFGVSLRSRVPGWKDMRVVQYDYIMAEAARFHGEEPLDINWDVHVVETIPGTIAGHGDQWNMTSKAQYSQMSNVAMEHGKNVIAGHTHRPLLSTVPFRDANGNQQSRFIMNPGHAMDITQAGYTNHYRGKTPTWGQAVGIVTVVDGVAHPELVQDHQGTMVYGGKVF